MKIIDSHSHWLPEDIIKNAHFFNKAWSDIEGQLQAMDAAGIQQSILSYPTSDAHLKLGSLKQAAGIYNDAVAAILKRYPKRFIGAAVLPVGDSSAIIDELNRTTQELGFKAVSIGSSYDGAYLDDKQFIPLWKRAQESRLPIFVHSQIVKPIGSERVQDPLLTPVIEYIFDTTICIGKLLMAEIFKEYPDVKFIFAYFGGVTPFIKHRYDATYQMLRGIGFVKDLGALPSEYLKQIYVDTSGDKTRANFVSSLELFGASHILWGSDYPAKKDAKSAIEAVKKLNIEESEKADILGNNAAQILDNVHI